MKCDKEHFKKIKANVVGVKNVISKVGEIVIPAPIGVDFDPETGDPKVPVKITPVGEAILNPSIGTNKLVNEGSLKILLNFINIYPGICPDKNVSIAKEVVVPIQSVHKFDDICPEDHVQEKIKNTTITVKSVPDKALCPYVGRKMNLLIKVILEVEVVISREEVLKVPVHTKGNY